MRFIDRTIQVSLSLGAILFVFLAPFYPPSIVWGLAVGIGFSVFNLWALRRAFGSFSTAAFDKKRLTAILFMKLPLFYGSVFLVFYFLPISLEAFAVGFGLPLAVMLLKAIGQRWRGEENPFLSTRME